MLYCDQQSVGQFVLESGPFWGPWPDFNFLCLTVTFFLLHVGRPLWQEDGVCNLQCNHSLVRVHNHLLLSHLRLPQHGGPGPSYIPRKRVAQSYPRALGSLFVASYDLQAYDRGILTPSTLVKVKVTLWLTVRQSVCLDVEPLLVLMTRRLLLFDNYCCACCVFMGRSL
jgi:hypothetical protein